MPIFFNTGRLPISTSLALTTSLFTHADNSSTKSFQPLLSYFYTSSLLSDDIYFVGPHVIANFTSATNIISEVSFLLRFAHSIRAFSEPCLILHSISKLADNVILISALTNYSNSHSLNFLFIPFFFNPLIGFYNLLSLSIILALEFNQLQSQQSTIVSHMLFLAILPHTMFLSYTCDSCSCSLTLHNLTHNPS